MKSTISEPTALLSADDLGLSILAIAITLPRIAAAFLIIPLLTPDTVPPLVRNSLFVSFAITVAPLVSETGEITKIGSIEWPFIILKEIFIGAVFGFMFGSIFWSIGMAGGIIDTQTGSNMASAIDPIQGHQNTLSGLWLSRFASVLFMASGGFMIFLDLLLGSYQIWPIDHSIPYLDMNNIKLFANEFNFIMTSALLICAPAMMILALVDLAFGLINRFAEQLNILALTMPIKNWIATLILLLSLGVIVETVTRKLVDNRFLLQALDSII